MISANPTLDVQGIYGTYSLTFNLNLQLDTSIDEPASNKAWGELVGFEGWLGTMLGDQNATFAGAAGEPVAQSSAPSVSYDYTAGSDGNVGTLVITINGLNVPEPTTATLSLLALAALAARRRRND
jgi:MYXO-CTERM domain-containing protein